MWSAVCRASSVAILILVIAPALTTPAAYAGPLLLPAIQPHVNVPIQPRVNIPVQLHAIVRQGPAIRSKGPAHTTRQRFSAQLY